LIGASRDRALIVLLAALKYFCIGGIES